MTVLLTHISALECLRSLHFGREGVAPFARPRPERIAPPTKAQTELLKIRHPSLTEPLHCGIERRSLRPGRREELKCHCVTKFPPVAPALYIEEGLYVALPEWCFLQMAAMCSVQELIAIGFELCGAYALAPGFSYGFKQRGMPLTTKKNIARFLSQMKDAYGAPKAKRALQYVREGSASPMETALAMLLGLPPLLGGYGLGMPSMNFEVDTVEKRLDRMQTSFRKCDLFWPPNLTVEYDSGEVHTGREALERDAIRRNDLFAKQVFTVSITPRQIYNSSLLEARARQIAAFLGKRVRLRVRDFLRSVVLPNRLGGS